jgi:hypothetical protein
MVPVTDRLFRKKDQSIATLALLPDRDGETLIQYRWMTFKKISGWRVWGEVFGVLAASLLMLSSPIFALVWGCRKLLGKLHHAGPLSLRFIPLLSTLFLGAFWGLIFSNRENLWALGNCCPVSMVIMLSSLAFALTALMSLYLAARHQHASMNRFAYWHSVLTALAVSGVAVYMGYWGWIGLRLWA